MTLDPGEMVDQETVLAHDASVEDLDPKARKEIAGASPTQIALERLRKDKVAVVCAAILFLLVLHRHHRRRSSSSSCGPLLGHQATRTHRAPPRCSSSTATPRSARRSTASPGTTRSAWPRAPATTTSPVWSTGCGPRWSWRWWRPWSSTFIGVTLGSGGRLLARLGGPGHLVLHRPVPVLPVPARRARAGADRHVPVRHDLDKLERAQLIALIAVLVIFGWMGLARLIRGQVLSLREREFILAARGDRRPDPADPVQGAAAQPGRARSWCRSRWGCRRSWLPRPDCPSSASGLTGTPSLGQDRRGRDAVLRRLRLYLWLPVGTITVLTVSLNLLGDSIRDAFDPRTRR